MNPKLAEHLAFAQDQCQRLPRELSAAMSKHQLKLADRQCRMAELSQRVQDTDRDHRDRDVGAPTRK